MSMLDKGVEAMGAAHRAFDKFGKRMWKATPTMDNSNKHTHLPTPSKGKSVGGKSSEKRSKSF